MDKINYRKISQVLWIILFANFGVAFLKIIVGSIIKSTSMTADGFHSLTDGSSNIVGIIGIYIASRPVDEDHPYGHKKFETLAGMFIAGMLFLMGGKIIVGAIDRFLNPVVPQVTIESIITLLVTLAINIFVCSYEYNQGKKLKSHILISDSLHTKSDVFVSIGVILTLVGIKLGLPTIIDPIASLVVSGFILHAAWEIFRDTSDVLVDKAVVDSEKIREITLGFQEVKDIHKIRSRGSENDIHIDMHILTEPSLSVEDSHILIHNIEREMQEKLNGSIQVIAHVEPFYGGYGIHGKGE